MAGSLDDAPTVVVGRDEYDFCAIGKPGDDYMIYLSRHAKITRVQVVARLRSIADRLEVLDDEA